MSFFRQRPDGDRQKGNVIVNIKLSSFNVEGLRGNAPYLETILPFSNILCLQEHWLWHLVLLSAHGRFSARSIGGD
jgi:hypothetical protein